MKNIALGLGMLLACGLKVDGQTAPPTPAPPDIGYVLQNLTTNHPRLFINQELLAKVKRDGLTPEQQEWLKELKRRVDGYPKPPPLDAKLIEFMLSEKGGRRYGPGDPPRVSEGSWSMYAAHAALAYQLTGEKKYFDRAVEFLKHTSGIYKVIDENKRIPLGHAFSRLSALSAYDWLFNDLAEQERQELGRSLYNPLYSWYQFWLKSLGTRAKEYVQYSDDLLGWHLGVVFHGSGIKGVDEQATGQLLRTQYDRYVAAFRKDTSGPDGVVSRGAIGYAQQLPDVGINFLDSWRTAIGGNFVRYFPKHANLVEYFLWNTIPARPAPFDYGWSDSYHTTLRMNSSAYLLRVADLYAGLGDLLDLSKLSALAAFQMGLFPSGHQSYRLFLGLDCTLTPASPLYMSQPMPSAAEVQDQMALLPRARRFAEPVSQTFMNSGWDENATYALFIAGQEAYGRKHYDETHFTIYKKGFLAMDTGIRGGGPGHGANYYHNTLAHNCVLIRMAGEVLPSLWGEKSTVSTGGMDKNSGAVVKGFETNDRYTYIAADATACYNAAKSKEVVRQFVFIYPDYFVVFDRVESQKPDQIKTWLFHTQEEPELMGEAFSAVQNEGKVCVRTLLPKGAQARKIGGPGKEFWAGDQNWPADENWVKQVTSPGLPPDRLLTGRWRMEIASGPDNPRELFLHLIQVGDRRELQTMVTSRLLDDKSQAGLEFDAGQATVRVVFNKTGAIGGRLKITEGGKAVMDRDLTRAIMSQSGPALVK